MGNKVQDMYFDVIAKNDGITKKDVKNLFIWYDLFSYALSFQLIFIFAYSINANYATTMLSALFILIMDTVLKNVLEKDSTSYKRLAERMSLVKLWTIPLLILGIVTTASIIAVTFGLV